ncbi:Erg28 like protein-domain-containing protein [Amylocarpus encephaloides]|uniref:Erg28 like protein-domain-containing protein n=1 Tax=Amylocarpus encephaloides TaxID=45428 RepID=A0A9P7YT49_9HELO|nr:Erg28 like protein-domain-containing protein [Amylocarpus encephaloides]
MSAILSSIKTYLPQHEGILPHWLLFVSIVALGNSLQAYLTTSYSSQVYLGPSPSPAQSSLPPGALSPTTPLSSRTFGTWCVIQSFVRLYAAYYISNPQIYQMAFLTYVVAWSHFMSEWWVFGTARWGRGLAGPVVIATGSLVWMWVQWEFYIKA